MGWLRSENDETRVAKKVFQQKPERRLRGWRRSR